MMPSNAFCHLPESLLNLSLSLLIYIYIFNSNLCFSAWLLRNLLVFFFIKLNLAILYKNEVSLKEAWQYLTVSNLVETNVIGIFTETLTADIQAVLADQTSTMSANTANNRVSLSTVKCQHCIYHWREPLPKLLGWEFQTLAWAIILLI